MSTPFRNTYFDFLRGFAIIMVVGIHTITNMAPTLESIEEIGIVTLRSMLNCAVPIFLAISGYFVASKKITSINGHIAFLKKQIPKVYIPCIVFSLPYLLIAVVSGTSCLLKKVILFFACGFSVYYFVALIIQYYILMPVFAKFNNRGGVIVTALISAFSIIAVTYVMKVMGVNLSLLVYAGPFTLWIIFFFMGVYFSAHNRDYKIQYPILMVLIGLMLQIAEYAYWSNLEVSALGIKLSSFIFSAGVIWLLFCRKIEDSYSENLIFKIVRKIGEVSFGIYLLHCYLIWGVDQVFSGIGWIEKWVLVLTLTMVVIFSVKAVIPKFSIKYFGFR